MLLYEGTEFLKFRVWVCGLWLRAFNTAIRTAVADLQMAGLMALYCARPCYAVLQDLFCFQAKPYMKPDILEDYCRGVCVGLRTRFHIISVENGNCTNFWKFLHKLPKNEASPF